MSVFSDFDAFGLVPGTKATYQLDAPLRWEIGSKGSGWFLDLPKGMEFDISVPWWGRWALSPHDKAVLLAAAIHDQLLRLGHDIGFSSAEFRRALLARGQKAWWAWVLFFATLVWTSLGKTNWRDSGV